MEELLLESYFNYEIGKVKVKALRDHSEVSFLGNKYGPFIKGQEIELPRALARLLAEQGITEYPLPNISVADLKKRHYQEISNKSELKKIEEDFYLQAKELLYLAQKNIIKEDPKEIRRMLDELCMRRLEKIIRNVLYVEDLRKIGQLMAYEERFLFLALRELLKSWMDNVLNNAILKKI